MSDISQPSAPAPSAMPNMPNTPNMPSQAEVPVNEAPVSQPTPLGDQAPPKPPGQESNKSSHIGRREALQNAFAKARQAQEEAAAKPPAPRAKPGMGHNNPPEPTAKERTPAQQAAEKAEKTSQPSEKQQRYREGGKFAKDPAKAPPEGQPEIAGNSREVPSSISGQQPQQAKVAQLDENARHREPPGRFSEQAKTEWHATPESVRGAVYTMAREFQGAYQKYKADHDVMEEMRPYHDLATKQGTSLRKAFDNYYGMEATLRRDLIGGLDTIIQNVARAQGLRGPHGGPLTVQDVAHHVVNMTPEQHQLTQQRNQQTSAEMQIGQLHHQVEQQSEILRQMVHERKVAGTRAQVDEFAQQHPRFDELGDLIKSEIDLGFTLEQAYQRADRLRPAAPSHAAQTRTTPAQTRKTSISGAPDGGNGKNSATTRPSDGQRRNGEAKHPTRREALARAIRRVGNGV